MPRDLPGFYWDPHRNRYFPINSARPSEQLLQSPQPVPQAPPTNNNLSLSSDNIGSVSSIVRRPRSIWQLTDLGKSQVINSTQRALPSFRHDLFGLHVARTSCVTERRVPVFGEIRKFISTTTRNGQCYRLLGDSQGWLHTSTLPRNEPDEWVVETNLDTNSEISSLNICHNTYSLATSFGPVSKMRVQKLDDSNLSFVITMKGAHDIRCSEYSWNPNEIVIGAKQHAVYLTNILNQPKTRILDTQSDVFSVTRQHDLVYAGTRNGSIHRFDLRVLPPNNNRHPTSKSTIIFSGSGFIPNSRQQRYSRNGSTVLHMQLIDDMQFLTSYMNGEILMYDIRYTQRNSTPSPVLRFPGHINTHTSRLGIATDSTFATPSLLFAAGQDRKLRGWSIRTGEPLLSPPPSSLPSTQKNPLSIQFERPIETLQIASFDTVSFEQHNQPDRRTLTNHLTVEHENENESEGGEEEIGGGMCLWAGCGDKLYRFDLGCMHMEARSV